MILLNYLYNLVILSRQYYLKEFKPNRDNEFFNSLYKYYTDSNNFVFFIHYKLICSMDNTNNDRFSEKSKFKVFIIR